MTTLVLYVIPQVSSSSDTPVCLTHFLTMTIKHVPSPYDFWWVYIIVESSNRNRPRTANDVSAVFSKFLSDFLGSFCVAGAVFGEFGG